MIDLFMHLIVRGPALQADLMHHHFEWVHLGACITSMW